ncbi:MAG: hypothetical protein ACFFEY_13505 [Candidatus Thorarchaeota archaeon]
MSNTDNIISLNITKFPQNLLISGIDNQIKIKIINHSIKEETFNFEFIGENLNIKVYPNEFKNHIKFEAGENKNVELKIEPLSDGFGKLTINANWLKISEYKVKVQKVREVVSDRKIEKILERKAIDIKLQSDIFNPENFLINMNKDIIKKAEKQLKALREELETAQSGDLSKSQISEKIDGYIRQLAKGYLSSNKPLKALEYALMLSNSKERTILYTNLIRAYSFKDFNAMLQVTNSINDLEIKQNLYKFLALDQAINNSEKAINTCLLIQDATIKEEVLINIYMKIINSNPLTALNLINYIEDDILKIKLLFTIAKNLYKQNSQSELTKIFNLVIETAPKVYSNSSVSKKVRKESCKLLESALNILAEIENPTKVNSILEGFVDKELKEKLTKDLFDVIYDMVDEIQTKIEATSTFSQYFLLNTYNSKITNEITNFSLKGGNISNNVLLNDFNFSTTLLSLFGFDFSIFPIIDRVYNDLKYSINKSFAYYVFPIREIYNEETLRVLKSSLVQFFNNFNSVTSQIIVLNLDFIPYLGKPTVIMSYEQGLNDLIYSKIKKIGDSINIILDDSTFKRGIISEELTKIFPTNKSKIVNLVLSYEFINDYNLFKNFIQSLL